jgi:hypothetical protein
MRVLFQMSANDSVSLCDDPNAGTLGLPARSFTTSRKVIWRRFGLTRCRVANGSMK